MAVVEGIWQQVGGAAAAVVVLHCRARCLLAVCHLRWAVLPQHLAGYMMCDLLFITQPLLLRPQGSEVPRPLLRAELGEADPRPCWAPGIANWQDPIGLTLMWMVT